MTRQTKISFRVHRVRNPRWRPLGFLRCGLLLLRSLLGLLYRLHLLRRRNLLHTVVPLYLLRYLSLGEVKPLLQLLHVLLCGLRLLLFLHLPFPLRRLFGCCMRLRELLR